MLYLINALTFDGKWQSPYKDYQVGDADFTAADGSVQTAEMMYGTEYTYLENDLATGFVKPYADGYSFVALLPHEGLSMACLLYTSILPSGPTAARTVSLSSGIARSNSDSCQKYQSLICVNGAPCRR